MSLLQVILINVNLIVFFGLYFMLAVGKRSLHFNRFYLLFAPIIAIILPFISFGNFEKTTVFTNIRPIQVFNNRIFIGSAFEWESVIFGIGLLTFLAIFIVQMYRVLKPNKAQYHSQYNGVDVYILDNDYPSHSFFRKIYINRSDLPNIQTVLVHEFEHCSGLHSIDLVIASLYKSTFWFNPVVYYWSQLIRENHEYIADQKVMEGDITAIEYGTLLFNMNFKQTTSPFINTFRSKSLLRKRIQNLNFKNQKSMKNLIVIPVTIALTFISLSMTNSQSKYYNSKKVDYSISPNENDSNPKAQFPGGQDALIAFFVENVNYPKNLEQKGITGKVFVEFTVTKNGDLQNVTLKKSSDRKEFDEEALRVINKMPNWIPAKKEGKEVSCKITLPIQFSL